MYVAVMHIARLAGCDQRPLGVLEYLFSTARPRVLLLPNPMLPTKFIYLDCLLDLTRFCFGHARRELYICIREPRALFFRDGFSCNSILLLTKIWSIEAILAALLLIQMASTTNGIT
jgi:hypothetical protein